MGKNPRRSVMQQGLGAKHSGPYTDVSVGTRRVGTAGSHAPSRLCAPGTRGHGRMADRLWECPTASQDFHSESAPPCSLGLLGALFLEGRLLRLTKVALTSFFQYILVSGMLPIIAIFGIFQIQTKKCDFSIETKSNESWDPIVIWCLYS